MLDRALLLFGAITLAATGTAAFDDSRYEVTGVPADGSPGPRASYTAESPVSDLRATFFDGSVRIGSKSGGAWHLDVTLLGWEASDGAQPAGAVMLSAAGNRVDYAFGSRLLGSYENAPRGIVQSFQIAAPPDEGPQTLELVLGGNVTARLDRAMHLVEFRADGVTLLRLAELDATDALGGEVPIDFAVDDGALRIVLARPASAYPVTVRGIFAAPKARRLADTSEPAGAQPTAPLAPPVNDTCGGATVIPAAGPFPHLTAVGDLNEATTSGDPVAAPSCAFVGEPITRSIWYSFTPSATGTYTFTTCADAPTTTTVDDPVMAIYTSTSPCGGSFSQVSGACDDDSCIEEDFQSFIRTPLNAGTRYYIVVWNQGPAPIAGNTSVQILVTASFAPNPPPNDTCAGAEVIPAAGPFPHLTSVAADITDAGTAGDPPTPSCVPGFTTASRSIWYQFTPAATGTYSFSSCDVDFGGTATTIEDTIVAIYTAAGCGGPFSEIPTSGQSDGCDDDGCPSSLQSSLTTVLNAGTPYWIVMSKLGLEVPPVSHTAAQLRVALATAPVNDLCTGALALSLDMPAAGSTASAIDEYRSPSVAGCYVGVGHVLSSAAGRDVVYSFNPPSTGSYSFKVTGFDTAAPKNLVVYTASDCPTAGAPPLTVTCLKGANRNTSSSSEEVTCLSLTAPTTVYIYVDEDAATAGSPFTIEVNRCTVEVEPNDTTATASPKSCGVEGTISPVNDVDFFPLGAPGAGARIFALVDGVAANTTDFDLRVTTAADTLEFDDLNDDNPFGSLSPVLAGTPLTPLAAFLRVNLSPPPAPVQTAEPYRLYSVQQPPIASAVAEAEPNDAIAQANGSPKGYFSGVLSGAAPSTDSDLFAFDTAQGDLIFLALDGDPTRDATPINAALSLLDASGSTLLAVNDGAQTSSTLSGVGALNKTSPFSPAEGLTWRARYAGRHYARVAIGTSSNGTIGAGNYLLSVSLNCAITDIDGDGVVNSADCNPNDPTAFEIPGEVAIAQFGADKQTLSWSAVNGGSSTTYDVLRGELAALPVGPGGGEEFCFPNLAVATVSDSQVPGSDIGYWYLVRGGTTCGNGTYGNEGLNGTPAAERLSTTCP